jgi:hypothetical protein
MLVVHLTFKIDVLKMEPKLVARKVESFLCLICGKERRKG